METISLPGIGKMEMSTTGCQHQMPIVIMLLLYYRLHASGKSTVPRKAIQIISDIKELETVRGDNRLFTAGIMG